MPPRTLTKSRFKLALECPTKVFYSLDPRYADARGDDEFLEALAEGGQQVGALAKLMYRALDPGAVEITVEDQDEQVRQTAELLARERVTIFEGTVRYGHLLVRVDVLVKRGRQVELIEVKAKSWDPRTDSLIGQTRRQNPINPDWEPYVYDVAFQHYVLSKACPDFEVSPSLLVVDKSRRNTVPGLGAQLPIVGAGRGKSARPRQGFDVSQLREPLLIQVDAAEAVRRAQTGVRERDGRPPIVFEPLIEQVAGAIARGERLQAAPSRVCKDCEFYCDPGETTQERRSGWAECMTAYFRRAAHRPRSQSIFGLYNRADIEGHLAARRLWLADLEEADLGVAARAGQISRTERHALQWREVRHGDRGIVVREVEVRRALQGWTWPLHFIDFETASPALPFHVGHRPYQPILFQFSHHRVEADGSVRHASECLVVDGPESPSLAVLRRLAAEIGGDTGTVLHWYSHERTILRSLREEVLERAPADADGLIAFLDGLGLEKDSHLRMFDLGRLVADQVFLPGTGGSSSMKRFLPAVLRASAWVRARYAEPIYGTEALPSLNYQRRRWVVEQDGEVLDPYRTLDPVFDDPDVNRALEWLERSEGDEIANGAAAMIAYAMLQDPTVSAGERERLERQLKRYCELDTLAMVMVYEALREWAMATSVQRAER